MKITKLLNSANPLLQGALEAAYDNDQHLHGVHGLVIYSEHFFFKALACRCSDRSNYYTRQQTNSVINPFDSKKNGFNEQERAAKISEIQECQKKLLDLHNTRGPNFTCKYQLVSAELARIQGDTSVRVLLVIPLCPY